MADKHPLHYDKTLGRMCAISSWFVSYKLKEMGYDAKMIDGYYGGDKMHKGYSHCWSVLNGKIIDLTYTQFNTNASSIYIPRNSKHYEIYREVKTVKDMQLWPMEQKPYKKLVREIEEIYGRMQ